MVRSGTEDLEPPTDSWWSYTLYPRGPFHFWVSVVIVLDAVLLALRIELNSTDVTPRPVFYIMEWVVTMTLSMESYLKVRNHGFRKYLSGNFFMFLLLLAAVADVVMLTFLIVVGGTPHWMFRTVINVIQFLRAVRVFRVIKRFAEAQLVLDGLRKASGMLIWGYILILIVCAGCGVFLTGIFGKHSKYRDVEYFQIRFAVIPKAMMTCFVVMTLEGWPEVADRCIQAEPWLAPFFLAFVSFSSFALVNLVTAIVVDATLSLTHKHLKDSVDFDLMTRDAALQEVQDAIIAQLRGERRRAFRDMADHTTRGVDMHGFALAMADQAVLESLETLGIEFDEVEDLLTLVVTCRPGLDLPAGEFDYGLRRQRGLANNFDILLFRYDFQALARAVHARLELSATILASMADARQASHRELAGAFAAMRAGAGAGAGVPQVLLDAIPQTAAEEAAESWLAWEGCRIERCRARGMTEDKGEDYGPAGRLAGPSDGEDPEE